MMLREVARRALLLAAITVLAGCRTGLNYPAGATQSTKGSLLAWPSLICAGNAGLRGLCEPDDDFERNGGRPVVGRVNAWPGAHLTAARDHGEPVVGLGLDLQRA